MNRNTPCLAEWARKLWAAPLFSARGLLRWATVVVAGFLICHALGWREHTTFLSGTPVDEGTSLSVSVPLGIIYMVAYFGSVLVAPIFLLAATLLAAGESRRRSSQGG